MLQIATPKYKDPLDYFAIVCAGINFAISLTSFLMVITNYIKITQTHTRKFMIILTIVYLIWQIVAFPSYFFGGTLYMTATSATIGLVVTLLTVLGQMEIFKAVCFIHKTKKRMIYLQYCVIGLFGIALIGQIIQFFYIADGIPQWATTLQAFTYIGFMIPNVIYENIHCVFVTYRLYTIAKSYFAVSDLNPEVWKSQYQAYKKLFILVGATLLFTWIGLTLWLSSYYQEQYLTFPNLYVSSLHVGLFHVNFVVLIFGQMTKVPLERHINKVNKSGNTQDGEQKTNHKSIE
ncbi:hypothetical protein BC833DRAFT_609567 [Globomyces pollinis-pini]|nr:hypothetical protein BC833DRAFT_609567 [Globomyces pollinis-pini]